VKRCYLPLASSAGWFERDTLVQELDRRLKVLALVHEEIVVDDGSYRFTLTETGTVEQPQAPQHIARDRKDFAFITGRHAYSPPILLSLAIDFVPFLVHAGLIGAPGVSWSQQSLIPNVRRALRAQAEKIARAANVTATLPISQGERDALVKNWLFDSFLAHSMGATISVDHKGARFVEALNVAVEQIARPKGSAHAVLRRIAFNFQLPDVDLMTWPTIMALRGSPSGKWLRDSVQALAQRVRAMAEEAGDKQLSLSVSPDEQAAIDDALGRNPNEGTSTAVQFTINFAPVAGFDLLNVADIARAVERSNSWAAMVGRVERVFVADFDASDVEEL
jgi:hypothetical protein